MGGFEHLKKYGAPLYGVAWPPGNFIYMAGGGNMGIENKCAEGSRGSTISRLMEQ